MTEREFLSSGAWKSMRSRILRRDKYLCQNCLRYGKHKQATTVHHIMHYDEHPELALTPSNLISLCGICHNKQHPEKGGAHRY